MTLNRKTKFLIGSAVIVAAVGALIYGAVRETSAYFVTMDEYAQNPAQHEGQPLRLAGRVADGSVKWDPKTLDLEFAALIEAAADQLCPALAIRADKLSAVIHLTCELAVVETDNHSLLPVRFVNGKG